MSREIGGPSLEEMGIKPEPPKKPTKWRGRVMKAAMGIGLALGASNLEAAGPAGQQETKVEAQEQKLLFDFNKLLEEVEKNQLAKMMRFNTADEETALKEEKAVDDRYGDFAVNFAKDFISERETAKELEPGPEKRAIEERQKFILEVLSNREIAEAITFAMTPIGGNNEIRGGGNENIKIKIDDKEVDTLILFSLGGFADGSPNDYPLAYRAYQVGMQGDVKIGAIRGTFWG